MVDFPEPFFGRRKPHPDPLPQERYLLIAYFPYEILEWVSGRMRLHLDGIHHWVILTLIDFFPDV